MRALSRCGVDSCMGTLVKSPERVYLDLKQASADMFGLTFSNPRPLALGLLNLKWKVDTEQGVFVLKQFSKERYESFGLKQVAMEQEFALREQLRQHEHGTPCPRLLTKNNNVIHISPDGERFVVMEFISGENLLPGTLNETQMFSLGQVTGHMHNVFNDGTHGTGVTAKFMPPSIEERLEQWKRISVQSEGNEKVLHLISKQIAATEQFDLDSVSERQAGWAHRDLWVDNILFEGNELSAILDFDRVAFDYPELDIARAIMSCLLKEDSINTNAASAFLNGYRTKRALQKGTLVRSLKMLWYLESTWWIGPHLNKSRYQEVQFEHEMVWLADNLMHLSDIFGEN